jgi:hypothetical protein
VFLSGNNRQYFSSRGRYRLRRAPARARLFVYLDCGVVGWPTGWAVAVTATARHKVVDRRRIELIEPSMPAAPIHHEGGAYGLHLSGKPPDDEALSTLVARVRASVRRAGSAALDELEAALPTPIVSISLRAWPADFPEDIRIKRRVPHESQADSIMYRQVLAESETNGDGRSTSMTRTWRPRRAACWVSRQRGCSAAPGQDSGHLGRRTTGWRLPRRSSLVDPCRPAICGALTSCGPGFGDRLES